MSGVTKFRGYDLDHNRWRFGHYYEGVMTDAPMCLHDCRINRIIVIDGMFYHVDPKSVGQFTGLKDSKGIEIWEGDIVTAFCNINKISDPDLTSREPEYDLKVITKKNGSFVLANEKYSYCGVLAFSGFTMPENLTVVGNIYQNPELLKGEV